MFTISHVPSFNHKDWDAGDALYEGYPAALAKERDHI
jgi:hypothetical protein